MRTYINNICYKKVLKCRSYFSGYKRLLHSLFYSYSITFDKKSDVDFYNVLFCDTTKLKNRRDYELMADRFHSELSENLDNVSRVCFYYSFNLIDIPFKMLFVFKLVISHGASIKEAIQFSQISRLEDILLPKIDTCRLRTIITFCDAHPEDNFIAQFFSKLRVRTFTLQHGFYVKDNSSINSEVYNNFVSDYMLCWGRLSVNNLSNANVPQRKLISFGCFKPRLASQDNPASKMIVIFLNGIHSSVINEELICLHKKLISFGVKNVKIKKHPDDRSLYGLPRDYFIDVDLMELIPYLDCGILGGSGVFVDLYLHNVPFYIINSFWLPDEYSGLPQLGSEQEILSNVISNQIGTFSHDDLINKDPDWDVFL
ncbi:hypothetical protein EEJ34_09375 [Vibrio cholerae]|nr:hypothetical protein EEJ34_09375 [Vibrio cholerae]